MQRPTSVALACDDINFFGVINVDVEAERAKLDGSGWRPLRPAQLRQFGLIPDQPALA